MILNFYGGRIGIFLVRSFVFVGFWCLFGNFEGWDFLRGGCFLRFEWVRNFYWSGRDGEGAGIWQNLVLRGLVATQDFGKFGSWLEGLFWCGGFRCLIFEMVEGIGVLEIYYDTVVWLRIYFFQNFVLPFFTPGSFDVFFCNMDLEDFVCLLRFK